jgi:Flp pilus assembly protein TadD
VVAGRVLFRAPTVLVEEVRAGAAGRVAVTFTPFGFRDLASPGFGVAFLVGRGFDVIAVKSTEDAWFRDLPDEALDLVAQVLAVRGDDRRVGYGSSMGGFAALAFSRRLGLRRVLALSPQYSIDDAVAARWAVTDGRVSPRTHILPECLAPDAGFTIVYDPADPMETDRLRTVLPTGRTTYVPCRYSGHPSGRYLAEIGVLPAFAGAVLEGDPSWRLLDLRRDRRRSRTYLRTFATHLERRGRSAAAITALRAAVALDGRDPSLLFELASLLARAGHDEEALAVADEAAAAEPENPFQHHQRAVLLARAGRLDDALAAAREAVSRAPSNGHLHHHLGVLLERRGRTAEAVAAARTAATLLAGNSLVQRRLSVLLVRAGRPDEAVEPAREAVRLAPADTAAADHLRSVLATVAG